MWNINKDKICIAISGLSGCGNTTVSKLLASTLDIKFINYTFRNLAEEEGIDFDELRKMAESDDKWDLLVDQKQVELASKESSVIGSRLAIWMLSDADIRVYLNASEEVRGIRIQKREGGSLQDIMSTTHARDLADRERYTKLYQIDVTQYRLQADLVIDVNNISPQEIVDVILQELEKKSVFSNK